jgi:hypothetical protein
MKDRDLVNRKSAPPQQDDATNYRVRVVPPGAAAAAPADKAPSTPAAPVAIFVAHGMGQQIPFETLDAIAESLRKYDLRSGGDPTKKPYSNSIKYDDKLRLQRIELRLKSGDSEIEAHVYEGYWAPLTEGKITARNVIAFLGGGGSNGLKIARGKFRRWLFGEYHHFATPFRSILYLLVALATVASLVVLNSAIAAVAAARAFLGQSPAWLTGGLFGDLTTTFNAVVATMVLFALSLAISHYMRRLGWPRALRILWGSITTALFVVTLFIIILAGAAVIFLFYSHVRGGLLPDEEVWSAIFPGGSVERFDLWFGIWAIRLALVVGGLRMLWWLGELVAGFLRDVTRTAEPRTNIPLTIAITLVFAVLVGALAWLIETFLPFLSRGGVGYETFARGIAWPLLIALSAFVRSVLVQYVGDVAIYVMPYKLDAFNDLRKEIKEAVYNVAHAVYSLRNESGAAPKYAKVIVLGHSLGSVIAYDALNRLILDDKDNTQKLDVVERTSLFLTFGSPLDKTAFIFGAQGHGTTEAREALAAAVQPLIQDYSYRPKRWINIYSPWDIISGSLDLYDLDPGKHPEAVKNVADRDATTLLMAHTEYWSNELLVKTLYDAVTTPN